MIRRDPDEDEWFEISDRDWLDPKFKAKKLKLLADAQIPEIVAAEIRSAGITLATLPQAARRRGDPDILSLAQSQGRVLLTLDGDFWDDRKFPLQVVQGGIIYIAEPPDQHDRILLAFGLVYGCFAKSYPLDWWHSMKVKGVVGQFEIKMRNWQGKVTRYKMKLKRGYVVAKELEGT